MEEVIHQPSNFCEFHFKSGWRGSKVDYWVYGFIIWETQRDVGIWKLNPSDRTFASTSLPNKFVVFRRQMSWDEMQYLYDQGERVMEVRHLSEVQPSNP